ncbi:DUF2577 domain-containing protein [Brevibacillus parabrevis]|uniref:DUF2577 domain-containing protein n=1 Tax=Brevibacillus parabrevis TaxID=54914 RepID=UPI001C228DF6|nr:DUF2577 domain-containing protein [Brevibacillus parabrevis]MBU8715386.1 DUF2577 domain-containing protein [Brevibacillus parabrevis]
MADRLEGSGFSQLRQVIAQVGRNDYDKFELATVTSPPPELRIKIDNMSLELDHADLIVAQHLTRHTRIATITHEQGKERDVGDITPFPKDHDSDGDLHRKLSYIEFQFEDVLKPGDRVYVSSMNDGQTYVVHDKAVIYGGA